MELDQGFVKLKPAASRGCYNCRFLFCVCALIFFFFSLQVSSTLLDAIEMERDLAAFLLTLSLFLLFQFADLVVGF